MKGFTISVVDNHVKIKPSNLTIDEFIALAANGLQLSLRAAYNQMEAHYPEEADKKALRAALYDRLILLTTEIAQGIYPEYEELYEKSPEAFLQHLEETVKKINEHQQQSNDSQSQSTDSEEPVKDIQQE